MTTATTPQTAITSGTWSIDKTHSQLSFRVHHLGISWLRGGFADFDVTFTASEDANHRLSGTTQVNSISFPNEQLHGHLMSPDFFDAQLHPQLTFESENVTLDETGTATVHGSLMLRGITHPITLKGTWTHPIEGMGGDTRFGLTLTGELDRHAYGISWNAKLAGGGDVVGGKVFVDAALELVRA